MVINHYPLAVIKVVGIGNGGINAMNRVIHSGLRGVEFVAIDTDSQALSISEADIKLEIGRELTRGLGAGADPEIGRRVAEDRWADIEATLKGADMVVLLAGEGGGTGTGAAPVVARIAKIDGALTVGVVTRPFGFEGKRRSQQADDGIEALRAELDTLIVVPCEPLLGIGEESINVLEALSTADDWVCEGVLVMTDSITAPGLINISFEDVRYMLNGAGLALMGIGTAMGENRFVRAAEIAVSISSSVASIGDDQRVLILIQSDSDFGLAEINEAIRVVQEAFSPEASIFFNARVNDDMGGDVRFTLVATGLEIGATDFFSIGS